MALSRMGEARLSQRRPRSIEPFGDTSLIRTHIHHVTLIANPRSRDSIISFARQMENLHGGWMWQCLRLRHSQDQAIRPDTSNPLPSLSRFKAPYQIPQTVSPCTAKLSPQ